MAILKLDWDGSIALDANALAYRASKRIKTVGGAWITTGFNPANDMATSINSTDATVTANKVYEFKLEMICNTGGPTPNPNGVIEQIAFECIEPDLSADNENVSVHIDLAGTDITKARLILRRQDTNLIAGGPVIANNVADAIDHTFTGLEDNVGYYLTVELYAIVGGVEVISSDTAYLGSVCGGNVSGYQVSTDTSCTTLGIESPDNAQIEWVDCNGNNLSTTVAAPMNICTNGDPINIVSGNLVVNTDTPGVC